MTVTLGAIRVLIVDDHEMVRRGICSILTKQPGIEIVGEADSVASAIQEARKIQPDIILMDIRLPDGSGSEACRQILETHPNIKVIFLSCFVDNETLMTAVLAGAKGYVLKQIEGMELTRTIHEVAKGGTILDPSVVNHTLSVVRDISNTIRLPAGRSSKAVVSWIRTLNGESVPRDPLSAQEQRVLALVAQGKTNKEIAVELNLSDKTVKNYLAHVFQKLQISRRTQAAALYAKQRQEYSS